MKVIFDIPDRYFDEILNDCEKKSGIDFTMFREELEGLKRVNLALPPIIDKGNEPLFKWMASLVIDYITTK